MSASDIRPYRLAVPDQQIADLRDRLHRTRWPDDYADHDWDFGTDQTYLKALCEYWADGYDWRSRETRLNAWPHFIAPIDGHEIHFIHVKSADAKGAAAADHPWLARIVRRNAEDHPDADRAAAVRRRCRRRVRRRRAVVAGLRPLQPSNARRHQSARDRRRLRQADAASRLRPLRRSGRRFRRQHHGLAGARSCRQAGRLPSQHDAGSLRPSPEALAAKPPSDAEKKLLAEGADFVEREGGYSHIQRTKPQTLGYGLNDSPAGLAAWIVEKFRTWSDCGGNVESVFSRDELLDNISLYWFTQTITSSVRLYRESARVPLRIEAGERISPPFGFARFPKELVRPPREWPERFFNLVHWTDMPRGGHFAAMEQPELLAQDIREILPAI